MESKPITIKEIGRRLGLSKSTVSRALRDSPEIGAATKARVQALAHELSYTPNPVALSLQRSRSQTLAVVVPEINNSFFAAVISGLEDVASRAGYYTIIYQSHESSERENSILRNILARHADGLMISTASQNTHFGHLRRLQEAGMPMVFFDRRVEEIQTHQVLADDFGGAFQATEHLIEQGCSRLACITGPPHLQIARQRQAGFQAALVRYNLPIREEWLLTSEFNFTKAGEVTRGLFSRSSDRPDGLLAASTSIALAAHLSLRENGLHIPNDVALIGFSDLPVAPLLEPSLSVVAQPGFEMGQQTGQLMIDLIEKRGKPVRYQTRILNTDLIIRKSTLRKG